MDFWIDQYDEDFEEIIDIAYKISLTEFDELLSKRFKQFEADPRSVSGLIKQFCKITMLFLVKKTDQSRADEIVQKSNQFLDQLRHSAFTQHDADILAATIIFLCSSDETLKMGISEAAKPFFGARFDLKLVHPRILEVTSNWYPRLKRMILED